MSRQKTATPRGKPFRFFELRDNIYDLLPCGSRIIDEPLRHHSYRLWRGDRPLQRFALVNKQFGNEYSQRMSKKSSLRYQDTRGGLFDDIEIPKLPTTSLQPSSLTIDLKCPGMNDEDRLKPHVLAIQNFLRQVTNKPTVLIRVYLLGIHWYLYDGGPQAAGELCKEILKANKDQLAKLEELDCLESLELYGLADVRTDQDEKEGKFLASYSKSQRWEVEGLQVQVPNQDNGAD